MSTDMRRAETYHFLASLTDAELLNMEEVQLYVLPRSKKTNLRIGKGSPGKSRKEAQFVSNSNPFGNTEVGEVDLTLGNIANPFDIFQVAPVHSSGKGHVPNGSKRGETRGNASRKCRRTH